MAGRTDPTRSNIAHLFRRAGFGARPDEVDRAAQAGYRATVEALLAGLTGPDPTGDAVPRPDLTAPRTAGGALATDPVARMAAQRQVRAVENQQYLGLQQWWLDRMIVTSTPLREKLTLIWHGHFATAFQKVRYVDFLYRQNQLLRTLGSGNFETLTQALAKDPAMMIWLDTQTNVSGHPNENFARELMELFTLGIGNYSETDVKEAARAFTGWNVKRDTGQFVLNARRHDNGLKTVLGVTGNLDGVDIVRLVTHQPASPLFIAAKLWSHLAYPVTTTDPIVDDLAAGYAKDLNITALLRSIFLHTAFTSDTAKQGLIKQPIEWVVGLARAFGVNAGLTAGTAAPTTAAPTTTAPTTATPARPMPAGGSGTGTARSPLGNILNLLAQEPFNPPNVGGWPQNTYWLNTATSLVRLQFGLSVGQHLDLKWLTALPVNQRADALATRLSIDGWGQTTAAALNHVASSPPALVALALSAPEYVLN
ncbi:MAG: DUF1800 domain-containing protein [Actinomycetota bacterium]|nr:DUF1800 domain-containing protein [Actinomycetota bacterium]